MKTVTDAFRLEQKKPGAKRVREVYYKRRYWSAGDAKYIWETTWRNIEKRSVTTVSAGGTETLLFELTDGTADYDSSSNPLIKFLDGDEFGVDGLFSSENYSTSATAYYSIVLTSKDIDRQYSIRFFDDRVHNAVSGTFYAIDTTVYHAYRFVIKNDLTLDLYVDSVFAQNMGAGQTGISPSLDDGIVYSSTGSSTLVTYDPTTGLLPQNSTPAWSRSLSSGLTVNTESASGGYLTLDTTNGAPTSTIRALTYTLNTTVSVGDRFRLHVKSSNWGLHSDSEKKMATMQMSSGAHRFGIGLCSDGIYTGTTLTTTLVYSMNCTAEHVYEMVLKGDETVDVYVDGAFVANVASILTLTETGFYSFAVRCTQSSQIYQWAYGQVGGQPAITRIWYQRTVATAGGDVLTPEQRATSKIISVSPISWQLDSDQLTEFKVSNVNIVAENSENEWNPDNPSGHFAPNATVTAGFEPYWTKFQIRSGYELPDGTTELVNLFTGLAIEFRRDSRSRNVQIDILGQEAYMLNSDAEKIATTVTAESIGTGNGVIVDFETANPGVGGVLEVKVNGVVQIEGSDYEVSQLNEHDLPANIAFTNAPDIGFSVTATYFFWPLDIEFNDLVTLLVQEWLDSDPANSTDIQPFVVANGVINSEEFTSQGDWDGGTKTRIDTTTYPGSMIIDWTSSSFRELTTWGNSTSGWNEYEETSMIKSTGTRIQFYLDDTSGGFSLHSAAIDRGATGLTGSWEFKASIYRTGLGVTSRTQTLGVKLFNAVGDSGFDQIIISHSQPNSFFGVTFDGLWGGGADPLAGDASEHTYTITRTPEGVMKLFIDGNLYATSSYNGTSASLGFRATTANVFLVPITIEIRDIYVPAATATAQWISPIIDWTTIPFAWGPFIKNDDTDRNGSLDGATIQYFTDVSTNNFVTSDGYQEILPTHSTPSSTPRRYVRVKILMTVDLTKTPQPEVNAFTIQAYSSSIPVLVPNLSGKNVYDAIQSLAAFAHYEFGITSDQVFFFRPKASNTVPVIDLAQNDFIEEINDLTNGYENIYSKVEITYANFVKRVEEDADSADSPGARFLKKTFEFSADTDIVIAPTADVATAMSQQYFLDLSRLKKRFRANTKFMAQLELSDLANFSFSFATDATSPEKLLDVLPGKIVGARYDTDKYRCEFDVEEVPA